METRARGSSTARDSTTAVEDDQTSGTTGKGSEGITTKDKGTKGTSKKPTGSGKPRREGSSGDASRASPSTSSGKGSRQSDGIMKYVIAKK